MAKIWKNCKKTKSTEVRIVKVKLKTWNTEILFTNLQKEIVTFEELNNYMVKDGNCKLIMVG